MSRNVKCVWCGEGTRYQAGTDRRCASCERAKANVTRGRDAVPTFADLPRHDPAADLAAATGIPVTDVAKDEPAPHRRAVAKLYKRPFPADVVGRATSGEPNVQHLPREPFRDGMTRTPCRWCSGTVNAHAIGCRSAPRPSASQGTLAPIPCGRCGKPTDYVGRGSLRPRHIECQRLDEAERAAAEHVRVELRALRDGQKTPVPKRRTGAAFVAEFVDWFEGYKGKPSTRKALHVAMNAFFRYLAIKDREAAG